MDVRTTLQVDDLAVAQRAAEWVQMRRSLGRAGRASIGWGVLNIVLAAVNMPRPGIGRWIVGTMMLLGVLLVAEGIYVMRRPTPQAMRVEADSLLVLALWNLLIAALLLLAGQVPVLSLVFGVLQWMGSRALNRRRLRYAELCADTALAPTADALERAVAALPAEATEAGDVVRFETRSFTGRSHWLARLGPAYALVAARDADQVLVATPAELAMDDRGEKLIGTTHKARITLGGRTLDGTVDAASLQRLAEWKAVAPRGAGVEPHAVAA